MNTLAPSFLIGSSSYLQVTRTSITSQTSSKFGQIGTRTAELAAIERLEKSPFLIGHRELILYPIDPNIEPLVLDSLFCISQYSSEIFT